MLLSTSIPHFSMNALNLSPQGQNLVYVAPTGAGKTLVSEALLLRTLVTARRDALFVLPYVALVHEKVRAITRIAAVKCGCTLYVLSHTGAAAERVAACCIHCAILCQQGPYPTPQASQGTGHTRSIGATKESANAVTMLCRSRSCTLPQSRRLTGLLTG